jgi:tetratricopeptide (TPR) repeat protein
MLTARRFPRHLRPIAIIAILLCLCAWATFPRASARQSQAAARAFPAPAWAAIAHGDAAQAESLAKARPADDPDAAGILGYLAARRGRYPEAVALLEPAARRAPLSEGALQLGLLQQRLGHREQASQILTSLYRKGTGSADPAVLARAARAANALGDEGVADTVRAVIQDANALYRAASRQSDDPAIQTGWGQLFLWAHDNAEALKSFQQVLQADAKWAPAHLGVAQALAGENPTAATAAAKRALEIDAQLADAHLVLARLEIDNSRFDAARTELDAALAVNPSHREALAYIGAIAYLRGDRATFDAQVKKVLAIDPAYSDVYRIAAEVASRNYRFEEAVALAKDAVRLDPANFRAEAELGMSQMRTGEEAEARRALERAFNAHPFEKPTSNLLLLLDTMDKFVVEKSGDLIVKFHPDEAPIMREYVIPLAHEALKTLGAKYGITPKGPILIEVFPNHDDFAVRTLGLPGMIGALGACFGRVVTMDSPKAKEPGTFSWEATLWHELAHVITLQLSNQRVPRWLTEGISVYEEGKARSEWGRDMEVPFAMALQRNEILKLKDLNAGFTRAETIGLAYYEASLLVDHIVATHGQDGVRKLLTTYGQGTEAEAALTAGLGVSMDQLQDTFDKALRARFAGLMAALGTGKPEGGPSADRGEGGIDALKAAAAANQGSFQAQLALGRALAEAGDRAAFEPLERASTLVPVATGAGSPNAIMAALAAKLGDLPRAIRAYRALLDHDHAAVDAARQLAAVAEKAGDEKALQLAVDRVVALDPFDAQAHMGAGRLALKRRDATIAIREFKVALLAGVQDKATAHCDLAESYLLTGRTADAKKSALAALEIAPSFERAQDLLLRAVEGK